MVFHFREQYLVPRLQALAVAAGDQVDRLGGAAGEDDFLAAAGVDEIAHLVPCRFVGLGRLLA